MEEHTQTMHPEAARLFALDRDLRAEADDVLLRSGLGSMLEATGYQRVGSSVMRTMTWRDLDFERDEEIPDMTRHRELAARLEGTGWCLRVEPVTIPRGEHTLLYLGLRVLDPARQRGVDPQDRRVWKMDLGSSAAAAYEPMRRRRAQWLSLLTEEARSHILAIKEAVCAEPEYARTLHSVDVYEAVLEHGVRGLAEFRAWWQARSGSE